MPGNDGPQIHYSQALGFMLTSAELRTALAFNVSKLVVGIDGLAHSMLWAMCALLLEIHAMKNTIFFSRMWYHWPYKEARRHPAHNMLVTLKQIYNAACTHESKQH